MPRGFFYHREPVQSAGTADVLEIALVLAEFRVDYDAVEFESLRKASWDNDRTL